jgi:hypothetical protein
MKSVLYLLPVLQLRVRLEKTFKKNMLSGASIIHNEKYFWYRGVLTILDKGVRRALTTGRSREGGRGFVQMELDLMGVLHTHSPLAVCPLKATMKMYGHEQKK